jgi:hypothetical protein
MAVLDVAGFVADLKHHVGDHGFHVHDERHFVETYSMRQLWEVDLHPEEACDGPVAFHLAVEVDPRTILAFEDQVLALPEDEDPEERYYLPLTFNWSMPPLPHRPDLLQLATELAGIGGPDLPLEVTALDTFPAVTDPTERTMNVVARIEVSLAQVFKGEEELCEVLDRCLSVSRFLLEASPIWLDDL